jgi:hypothetical protein
MRYQERHRLQIQVTLPNQLLLGSMTFLYGYHQRLLAVVGSSLMAVIVLQMTSHLAARLRKIYAV